MTDVDLKSLHVLIVDDDQTFRVLFESMLNRLEIGKVTSGRSGADALAILRNLSRPIDIILCDFSMESGNGFELLKAIRTGEVKSAKPETCFVMVTGKAAPHLVRIAAELDVNGFIAKPFSVNTLKTAITRAYRKQIVVDRERYAEVQLPDDLA
jgi:CheY-like chemotaxis protein